MKTFKKELMSKKKKKNCSFRIKCLKIMLSWRKIFDIYGTCYWNKPGNSKKKFFSYITKRCDSQKFFQFDKEEKCWIERHVMKLLQPTIDQKLFIH